MKKQNPILVLSVILFLIANLGFWLSKTIYNPQNFSDLVVKAYEQPEVTNAISKELVDKTLEDKPLARQILGDSLQSVVSGMLGSQGSKTILDKVAVKFQNYLTTNNRQDVTIEVGQLASIIKSVGTSISPDLGNQIPDVTPQTITLVKADSLPNINQYLKPIITLGPIAGLVSIGLLVYLFYIDVDRIRLIKKASLFFLIGTAVFGLLIPFFRTIVQGNAADQNTQAIVTATYNSFVGVLANQLLVLLVIFGIAYIVGYVLVYRRETDINNE